jgi:hypothetical protein
LCTGSAVPGAIVSRLVEPATARIVPSGRPTPDGDQRGSFIGPRDVPCRRIFPFLSKVITEEKSGPTSLPGGGPSVPPKVTTVASL